MADSKRYEITVLPQAQYVADQSDPDRQHFVFAYTIRITNTGTVAAKLLSRHWVITDADAHVQEVKGEGVVGQQPLIRPGESFEYTSGASLATAVERSFPPPPPPPPANIDVSMTTPSVMYSIAPDSATND